MNQRPEIETIVANVCKEWRIEDGDSVYTPKVFVDNDQVEAITRLLEIYLPEKYACEVLPISEEAEQPEGNSGPLADVAKMLGVDLERQEDGNTVYLDEIVITEKIGTARYSNTNPRKSIGAIDILSMLKDIIKDKADDCDCSKCVARRKVAESPE